MMRKFEFGDFLRCVQKYKVTNLVSRHVQQGMLDLIDLQTLVPPVVLALAKSPLVDQFDLSSVTEIGCG